MSERFQPVEVRVGGDVVLRLAQLDGTHRMAFQIEAAAKAEAIAAGFEAAGAFALNEGESLPVSAETSARVRQFQIECTLALEHALYDIEGADWPFEREVLAQKVRYGDPELGVPPLYLALGNWLRGPMQEIDRAGEPSGPSSDGVSEEGPLGATGVVH